MASASAMTNAMLVLPTAATVAMRRNMLKPFRTRRPESVAGTNDTTAMLKSSATKSQKQRWEKMRDKASRAATRRLVAFRWGFKPGDRRVLVRACIVHARRSHRFHALIGGADRRR